MDIAKTCAAVAINMKGAKAHAMIEATPGSGNGNSERRGSLPIAGAGGANVVTTIIVADCQALFRAGAAKVLALDGDVRIIAQCASPERMYQAIATFPGSMVLFASSLHPDFTRLLMLLDSTNSHGIVIAENREHASIYLQQGFRGVVFRNVTGPALSECVRRVAAGKIWFQQQVMQAGSPEPDLVGARVRDRLTPKEMGVVALIVEGCKNREIALRLKTGEQVVKNHLRSIYDKTGVSDRLELALFTIHHRVLAQAAAEVGNKLDAEDQAVPGAVA